MFLDKAFEPAIMVFMIAELPEYLARKVTKSPLPAEFDEVIARTWQAFRTCPPPMQARIPRACQPPSVSSECGSWLPEWVATSVPALSSGALLRR